MDGLGRFTTHSAWRARFSAVLVSSSSPSVMVQPRAQKDEIGARLVVPSSFNELMMATGIPKKKILNSMVRKASLLSKRSQRRTDPLVPDGRGVSSTIYAASSHLQAQPERLVKAPGPECLRIVHVYKSGL